MMSEQAERNGPLCVDYDRHLLGVYLFRILDFVLGEQ